MKGMIVMIDPIERQDAIDTCLNGVCACVNDCVDKIRKLPPPQPERLTDADFETIRIHLNAIKEKLCNQQRWKEAEAYQRIINRFMTFASAEPEPHPISYIDCAYALLSMWIDNVLTDGEYFKIQQKLEDKYTRVVK